MPPLAALALKILKHLLWKKLCLDPGGYRGVLLQIIKNF